MKQRLLAFLLRLFGTTLVEAEQKTVALWTRGAYDAGYNDAIHNATPAACATNKAWFAASAAGAVNDPSRDIPLSSERQ